MATIKTFEELEIWQTARQLAIDVRQIISQSNFYNERALVYQIQKSSGSIMDNIAEGYGRGGRQEFCQFLAIANGSCDELRSQIYRCEDFGLLSNVVGSKLREQITLLSKKIFSLINYLRKSDYKGIKYK